MNYNSNLKSWGSLGSEYPDNYSYNEGEQPVDEWDNYFANSVIEDIEHLIGATNNDLLPKSGGSLLSDLSVGDYGLTGTAGSVDFSGTEITIDGTVDVLQSISAGGDIDINGNSVATQTWVNSIPSSVDVRTTDPTTPENGQTWIIE